MGKNKRKAIYNHCMFKLFWTLDKLYLKASLHPWGKTVNFVHSNNKQPVRMCYITSHFTARTNKLYLIVLETMSTRLHMKSSVARLTYHAKAWLIEYARRNDVCLLYSGIHLLQSLLHLLNPLWPNNFPDMWSVILPLCPICYKVVAFKVFCSRTPRCNFFSTLYPQIECPYVRVSCG
jgi:hypothetical protein